MDHKIAPSVLAADFANIQRDGIRPLGGWPEFDWDGDWEVATKE